MTINMSYPYFKVEAKDLFQKKKELKRARELWKDTIKPVADLAMDMLLTR